ncbi:MAG: ferritin-like domain-containing protein [Bacteroidota bacterium]
MYNDSALKIDEIAERILTIDGLPLHSFEDYLANSSISAKKNIHDGETAVTSIVEDLNSILAMEKAIKEDASSAGDDATEDLMSDFIDEQEKTLWMMKAWLK